MAGSKDTFKSVIVLDENDIPGATLHGKSCLSAALSTQTTCPGAVLIQLAGSCHVKVTVAL